MSRHQSFRVALAIIGRAICCLTCAAQPAFKEYAVPSPNSGPWDIAAGPDGALWFTEYSSNRIGRITTAGVFSEYALPTPASLPVCITAGPDGALWFTESGSNKIGRITVSGAITEYAIPAYYYVSDPPRSIAPGPDGSLWFTAYSKLGKIDTSGNITQYLPPGTLPGYGPPGTPWNISVIAIASGPDGALWFTGWAHHFSIDLGLIGRMTTSGSISLNTVSFGKYPTEIVTGPDGALWFTEPGLSATFAIGRRTTGGSLTDYPVPPVTSPSPPLRVGYPYYAGRITTGPDGALWFARPEGAIGRITITGEISQYAVPTAGGFPAGIVAGPDGSLWFTEFAGNNIGRLSPTGAFPADPPPPSIPILSFGGEVLLALALIGSAASLLHRTRTPKATSRP